MRSVVYSGPILALLPNDQEVKTGWLADYSSGNRISGEGWDFFALIVKISV